VLVNNAGILQDALLGMIPDAMIRQTIDVNTVGPIYHVQEASRLMARNKSGSIINVTSIIGRFGNEGQAVYGASKAALIGLTLSAAKELARHNIRVNAVAPGFINTDMVKQLTEQKYGERMKSIKMGRIGEPEDVANAILFLASDLSSYVTGQVLGVDGGMLI
jgi:3-oxoacyl-[acyl-carrier protein] reductase